MKFSQLDIPLHEWFPDVARAIEAFIDTDQIEIYVCHDGDVLVLTRPIDRKGLLVLIKRLTPILAPHAIEGLVSLYETSFSADILLDMAEAKMAARQEKVRRVAEIERQEQEKKFTDIVVKPAMVEAVQAKRRGRTALEILIIDDDPFSQKLVSAAVEIKGRVSTADNGYEGVMSYIHEAPDVVFLDIGLPDVTGHEVLQKILAIDPQAYVVMLSGYGNKENVVKAVQEGARGFVGKPFSKGKLMEYIEKSPFFSAK